MKLNPQLFVGINKPSSELIDSIQNRDYILKPYGGLWTSTYKSKTNNSSWVEWCEAEQYGDYPQNGWLLYPKSNLNIYVVNCGEDLERLHPKYIQKMPGFNFIYFYDYEKLQQTYDGIHLTEQGERDTRYEQPGLYGWDCESTLWFRWCFDKVEDLGEINITRRDG